MNAGVLLREAAKKAKPFKKEGNNTDPYITQVKDGVTGDTQAIKLGSVMEIVGSRLKFDKKDTEQGVFVKASDGKEYRCVPVGDPKPAKVMVMLGADVSDGEFTLEVRTKIGNDHSTLKNIKSGSFAKSLTAVK